MIFVLSLSSGAIPCPFQVHWPNIAFPSNAKREVPQPLSFAACANSYRCQELYPF